MSTEILAALESSFDTTGINGVGALLLVMILTMGYFN